MKNIAAEIAKYEFPNLETDEVLDSKNNRWLLLQISYNFIRLSNTHRNKESIDCPIFRHGLGY